jgi:hypothetical protein
MIHVKYRRQLEALVVVLLFSVTLWTVLAMLSIVVSFINEGSSTSYTVTVWMSRLPLVFIGFGLLMLVLRIPRGQIIRSLCILVMVNSLVFGLFFFQAIAMQLLGSVVDSADTFGRVSDSWQKITRVVLFGFPAALYLFWLWSYAHIKKLVALSYSFATKPA